MEEDIQNSFLSELMTKAHMGWWEADSRSESYMCSEYISNLLGLGEDRTISFSDFNSRILQEGQRYATIHSFDNTQPKPEVIYLLDTVKGAVWIRSKICFRKEYENGNIKVYGIAEELDGPNMTSAYQALQRSERLLHNIYKNLPVGIELYDLKGILIDMNDKEWKEDLLGINIFDNPNFPE